MKYLFSFIIAVLISLPSYSAEYRLPFVESQDGFTKIPFIENEWILGSGRDEWDLYIEKGMLDRHKEIYEFHAVTAYKKPYFSDALKTQIDKIYTYGVLDCRQGYLHILFEWYVHPDETLVHRSGFEFGAYTVEMTTPNSARNEVYNQICGESV